MQQYQIKMTAEEKLEKIYEIYGQFLEMLPYDYKKYEQEVCS